MGNLERYWTFAIMERTIVSISNGVHNTIVGISPCDGFTDVLSGCGSTIGSILTALILGTIAGAPDLVNVLFLAVMMNGLLVIGFLKWGRGVNDA